MTTTLWDHEEPVTGLGIDVPRWIDSDIDPATIAAILQGGCASGAYMPAVTYHQALATMSEHGDDVFESLDGYYGEVPTPNEEQRRSWSALACFYLSAAVEAWASSVEDEVTEALAGDEDDES